MFCSFEPNFLKIVMHAGYVVLQTGVKVGMAITLRRAAIESAEFKALLAFGGDGLLSLDTTGVEVGSRTAQSLKAALRKMESAIGAVRECAASIETTSVEMTLGNADLHQRTEAQATGLRQTAVSMQQLSSSRAPSSSVPTPPRAPTGSPPRPPHRPTRAGQWSAASSARWNASRQAGDAVRRLDSMTEANSQMVEQSSAAAARLKDHATGLTQVVAAFRTGSARVGPIEGHLR